MIKYLLDTNVILSNSNCIENFSKSEFIIHERVLQELDKFKTHHSLEGKNCRYFIKILADLVSTKQKNLKYKTNLINFSNEKNNCESVDDELLQVAKNNNYVLVTNDLLLQLKCKKENVLFIGLQTNVSVEKYTGVTSYPSSDEEIDTFFKHKNLTISTPLKLNEYCLLQGETKKAICKYNGKHLQLFPTKINLLNIKPKNDKQICACDLLLHDNISLVGISGVSGTGKTLLSVAYALMKMKNKEYDHLYISKPICSVGGKKNDLGFLPGDIDSKLTPIFASFFDAVSYVKQCNKEEIGETNIEFLPITHLRGRSLHNSIVILDECQNCTVEELKTLITRAGQNTKIILLADINQIDNHAITKYSNGFTKVVEQFTGQDLFGFIELDVCERSRLAELGATLL